MTENEQTGLAGAARPPHHEQQDQHGGRAEAVAQAAEADDAAERQAAAGIPGIPDVPWTPPPRRGRQASDPGTPRDEAEAASHDDRRTRAGRRGARTDDARHGGSRSLADLGTRTQESGPADHDRRRGWVLWAVIGSAVVVVVAAVIAFALLSGDGRDPVAETTTTTMAVPEPTTAPLDRTGSSALVQALPGTVRQFVLTTVEPADGLEGALEAWTSAYAGEVLTVDGSPAAVSPEPAGTTDQASAEGVAAEDAPAFTVTVGQWEDAERATAGAQALAADLGEPTETADVTVGEDVTGSLSFYLPDDAATGTAVWTNGTVAIRAVGPSSELVNFATAFGL